MSAPAAPRVVAELNRALHELFAGDERVRLLGEDVVDPYGGPFKVTSGLSSQFPDRVIATPISEGGIVGVGAGLALCGDPTIVEIMFGDFVLLGLDQLVNFAAKSVSMYGAPVPMPLLLRCPVGGGRGYGPTHSQSPHKHLIGVPDLALYELSPFHDPAALLAEAIGRGAPAVLFEDKLLYGSRLIRPGDGLAVRHLGGAAGWAHVPSGDAPRWCVVATGGAARRAVDAARRLAEGGGPAVDVLVPGRLYPLDLEPVHDLLTRARRVAVVEEGTEHGGWADHVAALLQERLWRDLDGPVLRVGSAESIIPAARHLEDRVLLSADRIVAALRDGDTTPARLTPLPAAPIPTQGPEPVLGGVELTLPKLNTNDDTFVLTSWIVEHGRWVDADEPVVTIETSKAEAELAAPAAGYLRHAASEGAELAVGALLAHIAPDPVLDLVAVPDPGLAGPSEDAPAAGAAREHRLDRAQRGTAAVVTRSYQEIPAAFTVVRVEVGSLLDALDQRNRRTGLEVGLADALVVSVARAHADFGECFGTLGENHTVSIPDEPVVGVTLDPDGTLYVPSVRGAATRPIDDVSDTLMELRMKAMRHDFRADELDGANITVSLNFDDAIVLVAPLVLWPQICMVSVGAVLSELRPGPDGTPRAARVVHLGLAYDHRVINGRLAAAFLGWLRTTLEDPGALLDD